jgi:hypothetical protein
VSEHPARAPTSARGSIANSSFRDFMILSSIWPRVK